MVAPLLSPGDRRKVADAIAAAEKTTSGEIYCVFARSSDDYFFPAAFMLTIGMLVASLAVAFLARIWWIEIGVLLFVILQAAALAAAIAVLWGAPSLCIRLTPRRLRYRRAHENAAKQFLAHNVHVTARRTGVLIFVSMAERYAEIVADAGIDEKVPQSEWDGIVSRLIADARQDRLADGFAAAAEAVGKLLAIHFPPGVDDPNELDDHLVVL